MDQINDFLENQHPLVRSNIRLGIVVVGGVFALYLLIWGGVGFVSSDVLFQFESVLQVVQTLILLLAVMMIYNALKSLYHYVRRQGVFTGIGVSASLIAVIGVLLAFFNMPTVFARAVSFYASEPYDAIYNDVSDVCDALIDTYGETTVTISPEEGTYGVLEDISEIYQVRNTIYFNFSEGDADFGFACLVRGDNPPDTARARDYTYKSVTSHVFQFVEEVANP